MFETKFNTKDEEIEYWKSKAEEYHTELINTQEEYQLYEVSSKELEHELELQLNEFEDRNKNLLINNDKINLELENLKIKFKDHTINYNKQISDLQDELTRLRSEKSTLQKYVRELEQTNDDLERAYRATVVSLQDFEEKLNIAIEKNAILENELEEKETMIETVQRLKDEARDLRQDLEVKEVNIQFNRKAQQDEALFTSMIEEHDDPIDTISVSIQTDISMSFDSIDTVPINHNQYNFHINHNTNNINIPHNNRYSAVTSAATSTSSPCMDPLLLLNSKANNSTTSAFVSNTNSSVYAPLTPAARMSALNLVSDMLRKVGAIEHKLTSASQRSGYSISQAASTVNNNTINTVNHKNINNQSYSSPVGCNQSTNAQPASNTSPVHSSISSSSSTTSASLMNGDHTSQSRSIGPINSSVSVGGNGKSSNSPHKALNGHSHELSSSNIATKKLVH